MTESSQQEFFLEHFQKVRDLLGGGDVRKALGVMLDVRENGFVNKELDTMINLLRDEPADEAVAEAMRWSTMIIGRLKSFGGDVFQLVEEFSEASLGLSEAEWVPVDGGSAPQELASDSDELLSMDFDDIDDMAFDLELEDLGSKELDIDVAFSDDEDEWGDVGDIDAIGDLEDLEDLGDFAVLDEMDDLRDIGDAGSEQQTAAPDFGLSSEDSGPPSVDFALVEGSVAAETSEVVDVAEDEPGDESPPAEIGRQKQETKPHVKAIGKDRETRPHQAVSREKGAPGDASSREAGSLRETARQPAAEKAAPADSHEDSFEGFDFDDSEPIDDASSDEQGFVAEPTRLSEPLSELIADQSLRGGRKPSDNEAEDAHDDFDFDLGFENPESRVETPASEPEPEAVDDADDFDFDFGFENPESRVETPNLEASPSEPASEGAREAGEVEQEDEFDFDLGFENPESKNSSPGRLAGGSLSGTSEIEHNLDFDMGLEADGGSDSERDSGCGEHRDPEETPASMPSIPRFRAPADEETSPRGEEPKPDDSLDDDEFFQLAESLSGDSSEVSGQSGPYRGEPLMSSSDTPMPPATPTPPPIPPANDLSEESKGRERVDTPNPFAHEAPTGVQKALLDSNSSFVLEEIRDSEVSDVQDDEAAVGALMNEARRLYEKGKFESAHDLLEAVLERDEVNDDAQELMGTVEGELERQHQAHLGSLSKVPELKVNMSDIPNMNLDHRFGYLLSQVDGMSSFEDILELSSMTRLETLEVLAQMIERDIISVD